MRRLCLLPALPGPNGRFSYLSYPRRCRREDYEAVDRAAGPGDRRYLRELPGEG